MYCMDEKRIEFGSTRCSLCPLRPPCFCFLFNLAEGPTLSPHLQEAVENKESSIYFHLKFMRLISLVLRFKKRNVHNFTFELVHFLSQQVVGMYLRSFLMLHCSFCCVLLNNFISHNTTNPMSFTFFFPNPCCFFF